MAIPLAFAVGSKLLSGALSYGSSRKKKKAARRAQARRSELATKVARQRRKAAKENRAVARELSELAFVEERIATDMIQAKEDAVFSTGGVSVAGIGATRELQDTHVKNKLGVRRNKFQAAFEQAMANASLQQEATLLSANLSFETARQSANDGMIDAVAGTALAVGNQAVDFFEDKPDEG